MSALKNLTMQWLESTEKKQSASASLFLLAAEGLANGFIIFCSACASNKKTFRALFIWVSGSTLASHGGSMALCSRAQFWLTFPKFGNEGPTRHRNHSVNPCPPFCASACPAAALWGPTDPTISVPTDHLLLVYSSSDKLLDSSWLMTMDPEELQKCTHQFRRKLLEN